MLLIVLKAIYLNWWSIVPMAKQWNIYEKESISASKQWKIFSKIH